MPTFEQERSILSIVDALNLYFAQYTHLQLIKVQLKLKHYFFNL